MSISFKLGAGFAIFLLQGGSVLPDAAKEPYHAELASDKQR